MPPTHIFLTFIRLTNYKKTKRRRKRKKKKRERKKDRNIIQQRSVTGARCMVENALSFSALRLSLKSVGQLSLCKSYEKRLSYTVKLVEFQKGCCRIDRSYAQFVPDPTINLGMQWTVEKITLPTRAHANFPPMRR